MKKTIWILAGGAFVLAAIWLAIQFFPKSATNLNNCKTYFDGCNTCMVQSGQIGGCTRMYCETPTEPKCLESISDETTPSENQSGTIDLSNCASYFDGCNTCTVKDGQPEVCTLMYCETPAQPKCLQYKELLQ